jgi:hypothetical protein
LFESWVKLSFIHFFCFVKLYVQTQATGDCAENIDLKKFRGLIMKTIFVGLTLLFALALPGHTETFDGLDANCRPNSPEEWKLEKTYQFSHQGKSYRLIWSRTQDASGSFCLAQGKNVQPIAAKYLGDYYVDRLDRLSAQVFTFQVHDGNGNNVPVRKYRLDLSNPQRSKVTLLRQWRE